MIRVVGVSHMFYVLVLDIIRYDNFKSNLLNHVVLCVDYKMAMMETGLYH